MKRILRRTWFVFLLIFTLGFFQERFKVAVNYYLDVASSDLNFYSWTPEQKEDYIKSNNPNIPYDYYYNHESFPFLHQFDEQEIKSMKWWSTLLFIFINGSLGYVLLMRASLGKAQKLHAIMYLTAIVLALVFFALGKLFSLPTQGYGVARKLAGFLQSPLPAIFLVLLFYAFESPNKQKLQNHE